MMIAIMTMVMMRMMVKRGHRGPSNYICSKCHRMMMVMTMMVKRGDIGGRQIIFAANVAVVAPHRHLAVTATY